jgi:hypothetical protein
MEAPLNERLAAYADALRELNFPFAEAYDELFARLTLVMWARQHLRLATPCRRSCCQRILAGL